MGTASMQSLHSDLAVSHICCASLMTTFEASVFRSLSNATLTMLAEVSSSVHDLCMLSQDSEANVNAA